MTILKKILDFVNDVECDTTFSTFTLHEYLKNNNDMNDSSLVILSNLNYYLTILNWCGIIQYVFPYQQYTNATYNDYKKMTDVSYLLNVTEEEFVKIYDDIRYIQILKRKYKLKLLKNDRVKMGS